MGEAVWAGGHPRGAGGQPGRLLVPIQLQGRGFLPSPPLPAPTAGSRPRVASRGVSGRWVRIAGGRQPPGRP